MKVVYKTKNDKMAFELDFEKNQDLWEKISILQEIFENVCGKCKSDDVRYVVRKAKNDKGKEFKYHELKCNKCGAKLSFGIFEDASGMFPKRSKDGKWFGSNGWTIYNKETGKEE